MMSRGTNSVGQKPKTTARLASASVTTVLTFGCVAEALLALLPPRLRERIPNGAPALAALHDVGKVSPGFQLKIKLAGIKRRKTEPPAS